MSTETFQVVRRMNADDLDTRLALQCAPVLAGVKISNLLNTSTRDAECVVRRFAQTPLDVRLLYQSEGNVTFLIYRGEALEAYFDSDEVRALMELWGYAGCPLESMLTKFSKRYRNYRERGGEFPHEIGLFLGYPAEDVRGFIEYEGKNFLYSGYWKVYRNLAEAMHRFHQFDLAMDRAVRLVAEKKDVLELANA